MDPNPNATARKLAETALRQLAADLKAGRTESLTSYLTAIGRFRGYSWSNVLLITAQRPDATHVAGFHTWNDLGRTIKTRESGILIFAPIELQAPKLGKPIGSKADLLQPAGSRAAYVFDISQTEGSPVPDFSRPSIDQEHLDQRVNALVEQRALDPEYANAIPLAVSDGAGLKAAERSMNFLARHASDETKLARSLALIHQLSAEILDELLPRARSEPNSAELSALAEREGVLVDEEAFGRFHSEYRDRLIESVKGMVRDRDTAEDITARAFQLAWEKRQNFRGDASPHTWIQAIARNEARKVLSRNQDRQRMAQFESIDRADAHELAAPGLVTDAREKEEDRLHLRKALDRIPVKNRRVLLEHFVDEFSIREIAHNNGIKFGTVLSRIHKGKQLLRAAWDLSLAIPHADVILRETASPKPEPRKGSQVSEPGQDQHPERSGPVTRDR